MYSTNRNIQIKLYHKLCKTKRRYITLQYNVWQDFSLARFLLHVFLRLVRPTLRAAFMSDDALKRIRLFCLGTIHNVPTHGTWQSTAEGTCRRLCWLNPHEPRQVHSVLGKKSLETKLPNLREWGGISKYCKML